MALDKGLVQNINLRANGDQLLAPMRAFGREINKAIGDLNRLTTSFSQGAHKQDNQLRAQVQTLQRLIGEASTLQNILTGAGARQRNRLLDGLDEQSMGKRALSASKLKRELQSTTTAADALEVRLAQLYKSFGALADQGRKVGQRDLAKALNTEEAIRQVRRLEQQISRLDARQRVSGRTLSGEAAETRAQLTTAQETLLKRIQGGRRVNFSTEIAEVQTLTERYMRLTKAEQQAAIAADRAGQARRRSIMAQANLSEPQLLAQVNRASGQFAFSRDQARMFDITKINEQLDQGMVKLTNYQRVMARAATQGRSQEAIERLGGAFERLKLRMAEATAQRKAFDALPENKMRALNEMLFGGGGLAFAGRIAGASMITTGVFAMLNAITGSIRNVTQLEDELAKLQAIAGATDQEMRGLGKSILDVSANSRYSTTEITQAATMIAQAGYSAAETSAVLKDAMTLAAASGSSPTEAIDTLTGALGAFQLQASESSRVVDTLVQGLNRSKLSINQMQAAIQYAGATAKENGVQFEELVAIAGSLANAGIRSGSTIGTGLRQLMVDLKTPTEEFKNELTALGLTLADVDVRALGVAGVVKRLSDAGFTAEQAYNSFEVRAASSFLAFRNQIDVYDQLAVSIAQQGAAAEANERAMDSFTAVLQEMINKITRLTSSAAGPFLGSLKLIMQVVGELVDVFYRVNEITGGWAISLGLTAAAFAVNPVLGWVVALTQLAGAFREASNSSEQLRAKTNEARAALDSQEQTLSSVDDAVNNLVGRSEALTKNKYALKAEVITLTTRFKELSSELVGVEHNYNNLVAAMLRYQGAALEEAAIKATGVRDAATEERRGLATQLGEKISHARTINRERFGGAYANTLGHEVFRALSQNNGVGLSQQNVFGHLLNRVNRLPENDRELGGLTKDAVTRALTERLDLMRQIDELNGQISVSSQQIAVFEERTSQAGRERQRQLVDINQGITQGMYANKGASGSGQNLVEGAMSNARRLIERSNNELRGLSPTSARALDLQRVIGEAESLMSRVTSSDAAAARDAKDLKDRPGERMTSAQVAAELTRRLPAARITSTTRSAARQAELGTRRGNAAQAPHVTGNALDMGIIRGMDPMEVVSLLEDMGLEVTEAPVQGVSGIKYVTPNHGTGPHWHFAWKPKTTRFEQRQSQAAEQAARELQQLMETQAGHQVGTAQSRVDTALASAKSGSASIATLNTDFEAALAELRTAKLDQFDIANPIEGLSETLLQQRALTRAALEDRITQEAAEAHENLWRSIADFAGKELEGALAVAQGRFDEVSFRAEQGYAEVASRGRTLDNNLNKRRFGDGNRYAQQRDEFNARLTADRDIERGLAWQELEAGVAVGGFRSEVDQLNPNSEGYHDAVLQLADAEKKLIAIQRERAEVQRSINERTEEFTDIPVWEGLKDSVAAWADSSGAMDSWATTLQNNVGPALDNFSNNLSSLFGSIIDGTASVKSALNDFLTSFGRFVLQLITKALALMAIKAILGMFGLQLDESAGGVVIGKKSFSGGPVDVEGKYDGGYINRGVSNRDSALYNLARGEYVIRNKSVSDIGLANMEMINKFGQKGLEKVAGAGTAFASIQAPKQETNVWVVADRKQAGMSPSDVLVTIHEDILQGGPTKKLIRQVSQGG